MKLLIGIVLLVLIVIIILVLVPRKSNNLQNKFKQSNFNSNSNFNSYKTPNITSYPKWPIGTLENNQEKSYRNFYGLQETPNKPYNTEFETIPKAVTSLTPVSIPDINTYLTESYINGYKTVEQKHGEVKFGSVNLVDKPKCNWVKVGYLSPEKTFLDEDQNIFTLYRTDTDKQNEYKFKAILLDGSSIEFPPEINFVRNAEILPFLKGTKYEHLGNMKVSLDRSFDYNFSY